MARPSAVKRDARRGFGESTDYDIRLAVDGRPILLTWYKGHPFEGWRSNAMFRLAEEHGVLTWDADGEPVIDESKMRVPSEPAEYVI